MNFSTRHLVLLVLASCGPAVSDDAEPFAAMIALHAPYRFRCRYVGQVDLAKKYGAFPMYRLTAAQGTGRRVEGRPRRRRRRRSIVADL